MKNPVPLYLICCISFSSIRLILSLMALLSPGGGRQAKQNSVVLTVHNLFCCRFCGTGIFAFYLFLQV